MGEERGFGTAQPVKPISGTLGLVTQSLELSTGPPDDIGIDPLQGRTQLRLVEVAVVGDPIEAATHNIHETNTHRKFKEASPELLRLEAPDLILSKLNQVWRRAYLERGRVLPVRNVCALCTGGVLARAGESMQRSSLCKH
jgi:hypothetical protein